MKRWLGIGMMGVAVLIAACGGGDDDPLSASEYFERLQAISTQTNADQDALADPESFEDFASTLNRQADILEDARDDVEDLTPPSSVEGAHNAFVSSLEEFSTSTRDLADDLDGVDNAADFEAAFDASGFEGVTTRFETVCSDLQAAAVANSITVDLDCGSDA